VVVYFAAAIINYHVLRDCSNEIYYIFSSLFNKKMN